MKCIECGKNYKRELMEDAYIGNRCFYCSFWEEKVRIKGDPNQTIVNGEHYMVGSSTNGPIRGFGGADFSIEYFDGRRIECNNLWHQGEIPEHFRNRLPDNAKFVHMEKEESTITDGIPF